jgi:hypothetical protein
MSGGSGKQRHAPCGIDDTPKQNSTENLSSLAPVHLLCARSVHRGRCHEASCKWGPRIIATDRQAPRVYPRMIPLCSRFDSVLFTPKMSAIASYGNFSRSPSGIGCGARGREGTLLALPGGAGAPPGDTTIPCEELADGSPQGLPEVLRRGRPKGASVERAGGRAKRRVRKRGPAPQRRRDGAPRGATPSQEGVTKTK